MATADEVHALKREVELLRQLLEQERLRGGAHGEPGSMARAPSVASLSPATSPRKPESQYFSASTPPLESEPFRHREPSPRRPTTAAGGSPSRGKSLRWKDPPTTGASAAGSTSTTYGSSGGGYAQFVPIDTKRGKWWIRDRQILSRNVPAPSAETVAMKVRETWQWSGRTVVVDKIITCPRPRDEEHNDDLPHRHRHPHDDDNDGEDHGKRREHENRRYQDLQDEAVRYRDELRRMGSGKRLTTSPASPTIPSSLAAVHSASHDSKQLAQEFIQPKAAGNAVVEELSEPMRTASQRMEAEMAKAAAAATAVGTGGGSPASGDVGESSTSQPQSPSRPTPEGEHGSS